jgi:hypothetical protein
MIPCQKRGMRSAPAALEKIPSALVQAKMDERNGKSRTMKAIKPDIFSILLAGTIAINLALLAGCQSTRHKAEKAPPPADVTPDSTFTVIKDFLIPDGDTGVYFQDTRLYPEGGIQPDDPFCEFTSAAAGGEIIRGVFTVSKVEYEETGVGPNGMDVSVTEIHLQAATTKKSYRLNCMLPLLSRGARFVTPVEIQGAVGGYMTLKDAP